MSDLHHEIHSLRIINADLERRVAALESALHAKEATEELLRESEAREAHIKHVLLAIRNVNQMIVQVNDQHQLINQACACLTETLGYFSAWIVLLDKNEQATKLVATAGMAEQRPAIIRQLAQSELPEIMRRALTQNTTVVANLPQGACWEILASHADLPHKALAQRLSFHGRLYGVICVSVPARYADDPEEIALFTEMANDLAFALRKIEDAEALNESTRMLVALMANIPGMVYHCDNDSEWTMRFVSDGAHDLTGYDYTDLVLHRRVTYASLIHPNDRDHVWAHIQSALDQHAPFEIEYRIDTAHGEEKWVWERGHGVFDPEGRLLHLEGFITDITERKQANERLHQTENFYRALIEHAPDGVVLIRGDHFVFTSPSSLRMFGYPPNSTLEGTPHEMTHPEDLPYVLGELQHVITEPTYVPTIQYRFQHHNGSWIWIESTFSNLLTVPGVEGLIINFHDISQRRQAEAALEVERASLAERVEERTAELRMANAELARAARLKDEFLANMSHELRTPLNDILGRTELLQMGIYGDVNESQITALQSIDSSGHHLLALITDILDLSKIEAGKLNLQTNSTDIDMVCRMSLHMVAQSASQKQIGISTNYDPQVRFIQADELRLKQILINLLSNAVKFTPPGGRIGLEVIGDSTAHTATFTVWDTGIGIAPNDCAHLFQPFIQVDSGLNRQYNGTGLGLALVQRLAQAHGGSVSLSSTLSQGSRFCVTLPWDPAPVAMPNPASATQARTERRQLGRRDPTQPQAQILLADDNQANSSLIQEYLQANGYTVQIVRDGAEALAQITTDYPDLVLMDIQMPGLDGLTTIRRIRATPVAARVPIIVLTALAMTGDRERCLEAGADAYLTKPVSLQALLRTITEALRH